MTPSEQFWGAVSAAQRAWREAGNKPAGWAETPTGCKMLCKMQQPRQFRCPDAEYWVGGLPKGVVLPPADYAASWTRFPQNWKKPKKGRKL